MTIKGRKHLMQTLTSLGLTKDQAYVYLVLMQSGESGMTSIARNVGIGRTKAYRLVDELKDLNLINQITKQTGTVYSVKSYNHLQTLVDIKESEVKQMKASLDTLKEYVDMDEDEKRNSGVISFSGIDGLKQVIWNTTKAKNVLKVFETSRLNVFMDFGFAEDVRMQYLKNRINTKDLTNEEFIQGWSNITEFVEEYAECRYISPQELSMGFEIYVYNDVVTLIDYKENEIFCIEIHNKALKMTMEQLFDFVWSRAQKMEITGPLGQQEVAK